MAQVRKNPLPAGRYFVYQREGSKGQEIFEAWLKRNTDIVTVEQKQRTDPLAEMSPSGWIQPGLSPVPGAGPIGPTTAAPEGDVFYLWTLKEPTIWPRGCGFPNEAEASVKSSSDATIRPPTPTAADVMEDIEHSAAEYAKRAGDALSFSWDFGKIALLAAAVYYFSQKASR